MSTSLAGQLLVATPALLDPNFHRTVVLVLEHNDEGALGVVLNRPSELPLGEVLPPWEVRAADPARVFWGGPVSPDAVIALARGGPHPTTGWRPLFDGLGALDVELDPDEVDEAVGAVRVFSGYAGWAPNQLEGEIEEGAWLVLGAAEGDAIAADPEDLWRAVLRRQKGRLKWLANFPPDLRAN